MKKSFSFSVFLLVFGLVRAESAEQKPFVVVVPSYNNAQYYQKNLDSIFAQKYKNYRVIYINDASTDGTGELAREYADSQGKQNQFELVSNEQNQGMLYNVYHVVATCDDGEIVLILDGDDWLADDGVLAYYNEVYSTQDTWVTYGGYTLYPQGGLRPGQAYSRQVVASNSFRRAPKHCWSPTRTFYAWLFKNIAQNDLMHRGKFFPMAGDLAYMYPLVEMAGEHCKTITKINYVYNKANPIADSAKNKTLQAQLTRAIRAMKPYARLGE